VRDGEANYESTDDTEEKVSLSYTVSDTGLHCVIILLGSQRYTVYLFIQNRRCCMFNCCETGYQIFKSVFIRVGISASSAFQSVSFFRS